MIIKCFNEKVKTSNKNCKVNRSAVCFLYVLFFIVEVYVVLIKVYTVCFGEKGRWFWKELVVGWLWKEPTVEWCGKMVSQTPFAGTVRNDHHLPEHKLRVLFTTGQWHRPTRSAGTHAMSQLAAVASRPHRWLESCTITPASRDRCSSPPGWDQSCWLATCQNWWSLGSCGAEVTPPRSAYD